MFHRLFNMVHTHISISIMIMKLNIFSLSPMHLIRLCLSCDKDEWNCDHPAKTNTEADRRKLCRVARVTLTVTFKCIYNELKPHWVDCVNSSGKMLYQANMPSRDGQLEHLSRLIWIPLKSVSPRMKFSEIFGPTLKNLFLL